MSVIPPGACVKGSRVNLGRLCRSVLPDPCPPRAKSYVPSEPAGAEGSRKTQAFTGRFKILGRCQHPWNHAAMKSTMSWTLITLSWLKSDPGPLASQVFRKSNTSFMVNPLKPSTFAGQQVVGLSTCPHVVPGP